MQLDIFEHGHDVMLRNDIVDALQRRDALAARAACDRLADEYPGDDVLSTARALLDTLEQTHRCSLHDHSALKHARQVVDAMHPLADRLFGPQGATKWLAPLWEQLALGAQALAFHADSSEDHAAPLWLRAGNWAAAVQAIDAIESWRRIPAPLAWMTEARLRLFGLQRTWPLIAELGWLSPGRLDELLRHAEEPLLAALVRKFGENFEGEGNAGDAAWFAAWALIEQPNIAEHVSAAQASQHTIPERAFRTIVELLGLERQGRQREIVERRKTLRDLHPSLYAAYMKTR